MFILQNIFISTTLLTWILTCTHAQEKTLDATAANKTVVKVIEKNTTINATITEGGKLEVQKVTSKVEETRPYGREHVTVKPIKLTTEKVIPISENISPETVDHKKTVPKKGVKFPDEILKAGNSTTNATTITTEETPKKPLLTESSDDEPFAPSHFVSSKGKNVSSVEKVPSIESYAKQSKSNTDYIVPIVGVILSVPLVAILLNVVYRRSKEWWHHRHYSRMDFLIDGMYNN